jgi:two-component system OmpR family sensor kinase
MSMSIRLRLTLLYSAILALTLILFGGALYITVANIALDEAKQSLTTEAKAFSAALHIDREGVRVPSGVIATPHIYIQLRNLDGAVFYPSSGSQAVPSTLPLSAAEQQLVLQGQDIPIHTITMGGDQMLLYSAPLLFFGQRVLGIVQIARPLQDVYASLNALRPVLLVGGLVATLLAFGAGWLLAGTALRPIARITRIAQAIGEAQDFDRRVTYQGPRDEVGRLATTFNIMLARLAEAYETQQRFVADASHELRTPLTSIRGNLALLRREPPVAATDRVAILADLDGESERMARLVGDLLTLARADAGRPLRREPVRVAPVRAATLRRVQALHPMHAPRDEGGPDVAVLGDRDALTQVLLVLLDNACKFTPPDGTVAVTTAIEGDRVAIAVRDTGQGIPLDALPHVFDRFYQGDISRTGTGAGLGLAIARALVEGQGGAIAVESCAGAGSAFTVTLPRAPMDEPAPALVGAAATSSPGS